jgi:hypothetical protein
MLALGFEKRLICYHYPCNHLICIFMRGMNYKDWVMLILLMLLILPLSLFYRVQIKISHQMMISLIFPLMARIPVMIFPLLVLIPMLLLLTLNLLASISAQLRPDLPRADKLQRGSISQRRSCRVRAGVPLLAGPLT